MYRDLRHPDVAAAGIEVMTPGRGEQQRCYRWLRQWKLVGNVAISRAALG